MWRLKNYGIEEANKCRNPDVETHCAPHLNGGWTTVDLANLVICAAQMVSQGDTGLLIAMGTSGNTVA